MDDQDHLRGETPGLSLREAISTARLEAAERSGALITARCACS